MTIDASIHNRVEALTELDGDSIVLWFTEGDDVKRQAVMFKLAEHENGPAKLRLFRMWLASVIANVDMYRE